MAQRQRQRQPKDASNRDVSELAMPAHDYVEFMCGYLGTYLQVRTAKIPRYLHRTKGPQFIDAPWVAAMGAMGPAQKNRREP